MTKLRLFTLPSLLAVALLALAAMPGLAQRPSREGREFEEDSDMIKQREDYFYKQRAFPHKRTPEGARARAFEQLQGIKAAQLSKTVKTPQDLYVWKNLGPSPITPAQGAAFGGSPRDAGRVTAIAIDPVTPTTMYAGFPEGGVWKSTDDGGKWDPLTDNQASLAIGAITIDPTNDQIIYAGTGENNNNGDAYYGAGILKSTDGGTTWTLLGGGTGGVFSVCNSGSGLTSSNSGSYIGAIAVNPTNNQLLLAAGTIGCGNGGVYSSADGGMTWVQVASLTGGYGSSVFFVNGTTAYAALSGGAGAGVYESVDGGQTWNAMNGMGANLLPSGTTASRIRLAGAASNPNVLYAAVSAPMATNGSYWLGLYTSVDGGMDWTLLGNTPDICGGQCFYDMEVAVSPVDPNVVYAGGLYNYDANIPNTVNGSIDGGASWTPIGSSTDPKGNGGMVHTDLHVITFVPDGSKVFVGSDGGIWKGEPAKRPDAITWTDKNGGFSTAQFYPGFTFDTVDERHGLGGLQDNGSVVWTGDQAWSNVTCGDGGFAAINSTTTPSTYYAGCTLSQGIDMSTTPGMPNSWTPVTTGLTLTDPGLFIPPFVMDPSAPSTMYFGTNQIYQTTNGGANWASISPQPLPPGNRAAITAITVAPSNSATVYTAGSDGSVFVTTNAGAGATWAPINTGLPTRYPTHVTVDFKNPTTAYITFSGFSGFNGDTLGHVFSTTNGGTTWTDISSNLPNIPANDFVIDIHNPGIFYVATDMGVYYTLNGGTSWAPLGTGLPNTAVVGLVEHPKGNVLIAVTHGRGAWTINMGGAGPAGVPPPPPSARK